MYLESEQPSRSQISKLTRDEIERIPIVGFPKLLRLDTANIPIDLSEQYAEKFDHLEREGLVKRSGTLLVLTRKGKGFISNIYLLFNAR
ncbi:MAG: hypothetical protein GY797_11300 [Deltaproteobacteria bacterium]|nr:hypothetical protein [Deltaproteobacteria bacterium]